MRQAKTLYFQKYFNEHKNNLKMVWKGIKDIIGNKPKSDILKILIKMVCNKKTTKT